MRLVLVAAFADAVGCGDDVPTSAPPDLSVPATPHDLSTAYTCRCMPDGSGRCCSAGSAAGEAACFAVDGGA